MSIHDVPKKGKEALQSPLYLESEFCVTFIIIIYSIFYGLREPSEFTQQELRNPDRVVYL